MKAKKKKNLLLIFFWRMQTYSSFMNCELREGGKEVDEVILSEQHCDIGYTLSPELVIHVYKESELELELELQRALLF